MALWKFELPNRFELDKEYKFFNGFKFVWANRWGRIEKEGKRIYLVIYPKYAWDGCSPKIKLGSIIFGTWDGFTNYHTKLPQTYFASLVHDFLYQFLDSHSLSRKECDLIFYELLKQAKFKPAFIYFLAVRAFGGIFRRKSK